MNNDTDMKLGTEKYSKIKKKKKNDDDFIVLFLIYG